jgi:signal transduction histidine kinase
VGVPPGSHPLLLPGADDEAQRGSYAPGMGRGTTEMPEPRLGAPRLSPLLAGAVGLGLAVLFVVGTYLASRQDPSAHRTFDGWAVVLLATAAAALVLARRYPVAALLVVFGTTLVYFALGYADGPIWLALVVAYITAIAAGHRLLTAIVAVAGYGMFPWLDYFLRDGPAPSLTGLAGLAAWLLVLFGVGEAIRIRRERMAEAVRMREGEAKRRASEERLRIAQELHDALGHHLSLINVQAGVALHVNEQLPEEARAALSAIKQASKEGLTELRSVLEILRQDGERAPRSPTSTLDRVEELIGQARAAGLEVALTMEGRSRPLPFGVDVAAFRIVQEALTNVARHAGPAKASVRIEYGEDELVVEVEDDGRGAVAANAARNADGAGKGIVGMRERAAALGGELQAGPRAEGGYRVRARLPVEVGG